MSYSTNDTDWDMSSTGRWWRRLDGVVLVVGKTHSRYYGDSYWISIDGELQKGVSFPKLADAQKRAERYTVKHELGEEYRALCEQIEEMFPTKK
jgi:hypothetical protein